MKKNLLLTIACVCGSLLAFSQVNLNSGLVACYPFSGNANDMSGNNNNGTVLGPVLTTDRFGNPNSAYLFDGVNDYINLGNYVNIIPSGDDFSLSVWIQADQYKLQTILMINPDNFYDRFNAMAYYSHNGLCSTFWDYGDCTNGGRLQILGTTFNSAWEHYVYIVNDDSHYMEVYKNGVLQQHLASSSNLNNRSRNLRIGGAIDVSGAHFFFDGKIDDMRLYDRVLNNSEIQTLYLQNILCSTTDISNLAVANDFNLAPAISNNGLFQLSTGDINKNLSLQVFNNLGQIIKSLEYSNISGILELNFSELSRGVYFLEISSADLRKNIKFIVE